MKVRRTILDRLLAEMGKREISILLGARQVGKSTLMRQLEESAKKSGHTTAFYDLEQSADLERLAGSPRVVAEILSSGPSVVFIDEFHYLENASKIFKAIYDSGKRIKIYASGSSSLEIHKHLKESLAGRFIKTMIFPLSLPEWRGVPRFRDNAYLQWGGMPRLVQTAAAVERSEHLNNIVSTYITKDIKGLIKEENVRAFNSLLYLLAQSQGSVVTASSLARETGLSESTVARHLELMAQTYVLHPVTSYSRNMANELKKSKKYYLFDIGIRNSLLKDFRPLSDREDRGALIETAVALHLVQQLKPNMELRFWRTKQGGEVDFVLLKNRIPVPVEVKSRLSDASIPRGVLNFLRRYPQAPFAIVFNLDLESQTTVDGKAVFFRPWTQSAIVDYLKEIL